MSGFRNGLRLDFESGWSGFIQDIQDNFHLSWLSFSILTILIQKGG
ncbi:Uncharacterized protein dnl_17980 [Desulfonema limicola]|uniref:Uncharacterized protein n=1 Tax=Desulfonema limicola TaxID=45656 RepID=A0A975GFR2_9BACT|nr:hypothetical protein [Desulfonema limicola]QTA79527.1 Uncharacterized protein dnl_17980 [Desulfonema limicola]